MRKIIAFAFILCTIAIQAQNPASIKWYQMSSQHFNVVFEKGLEEYARNTLINLERAYIIDTQTYKVSPRKISLFIFNRSVTSNAYARLAPREMVWYVTPSPSMSLSITPWNKLLAVHEFRHVVQYKTLNKGFTKLNYYLFGQYGQISFEVISTPSWFWEGDAVYNETFYTKSGRGRISNFDLPVRTMILSGYYPPFEKFLFRSYKFYYPNHYYLGYFMVSHVNRNYGQQTWDKVLRRTSRFSFWPFAFSNSLKKYTGFNTKKTYANMLKELDSLWSEKYKNIDTIEARQINKKRKKNWTNYTCPYFINKDTMLVLKTGLDDNPTLFYVFADGTEEKIKEIAGSKISYAAGKIVWTQKTPDARWTEQNFSDLAVLNLKSKKIKQITKGQKLFSPDISKDGKKIVAVQFDKTLSCHLVIIDAENGKITDTLPINENNDYLRYPRWSPDGKKIVFTKNSDKGLALAYFDIEKNKTFTLMDYQWIRITNPVFYKNYVLFNFDPDGIANIYAIDINSKEVFKVTSVPFGTGEFDIDYKNNLLIFSDYRIKGFNIKTFNLKTKDWQKTTLSDTRLNYFENDTLKSRSETMESDINPKISSPVRFNRLKDMLNVHSWAIYPQIYYSDLKISDLKFEIFGNNKLQDFAFIYGINSSLYKPAFFQYGTLSYTRFFPVFDLDFTYGNSILLDSLSIAHVRRIRNLYLGIKIPLNFTRGIFYRTLTLKASSGYSFVQYTDSLLTGDTEKHEFLTNSLYITAENRRFMAFRDISSRWGQKLYLNFKQIPFSDYKGWSFYGNFTLYLPGLGRHHSIILQSSYSYYDNNNIAAYLYRNMLPRGFKNYLLHTSAYKISFDYNMPLFYPDFGINPFIYIKRIRANMYADYTTAYGENGTPLVSSPSSAVGIRLLADFNIFRYNLFSLNGGIQISYLYIDPYNSEKKIIFAPVFMDLTF